jgi:hypothetical protein
MPFFIMLRCVMVALQILDLSVWVRILAEQQIHHEAHSISALLSGFD